MKYLETGAEISKDKKYRYKLWRVWNEKKPSIIFCMLNPSTADGNDDDPTIRRCVNFADKWHYGKLIVVNLFALRATNPLELKQESNPIGPENDKYLMEESNHKMVVCAWGQTIADWKTWRFKLRPFLCVRLIEQVGGIPCHLGLTAKKHPKHPLYLPDDAQLQTWFKPS